MPFQFLFCPVYLFIYWLCSGIGIVNAIEVAHAFPEEDGLQKFREWVESPDPTLLGKLGMESGSSSKKKKSGRNHSDGKGNSLEPEYTKGSDDSQSSNETQRIKEIFMSKHVSMLSL